MTITDPQEVQHHVQHLGTNLEAAIRTIVRCQLVAAGLITAAEVA
jgi:hypothetical protein